MVFSVCQNPKEVGSNANEEMDLSVRARESRQREQGFLFQVLYTGCQQKVWSRWKVNLPTSKDLDSRCIFQLQKIWIKSGSSQFSIKKKDPSEVCPAASVLVNSMCSQIDNPGWRSQMSLRSSPSWIICWHAHMERCNSFSPTHHPLFQFCVYVWALFVTCHLQNSSRAVSRGQVASDHLTYSLCIISLGYFKSVGVIYIYTHM